MTQKKRQIRGVILTLTGGTAWGFSGTCGQYIFANSQMESGMLAAIRMLGAGVILLLFTLLTRKKETFRIWKSPADAARLIIFAIGGLMFSQYAYLTAISYSNSGTATVFQNTGIILIMIVSCIAARRLPKGKEVTAAVLTLAGVVLLATHGRLDGLVISGEALTWGGLAALALTTYTLLPGGLLKKWGTPLVNGFAMLIGGLVMAGAFRIWEKSWNFEIHIILALLVMVVFGTVISFSFYLQGVSDIGPVKASMLACVEPVVATLVSALWLGTEFALLDLLGFALIIGGCLLVSLSGNDRKTQEKTEMMAHRNEGQGEGL